jgi:hypothetical protein
MKKKLLVPDEVIADKIHLIKGQKVMIDRDLAKLYKVPTKALKQAVKRNMNRFPQDFMFQMPRTEYKNWRSQIVTSNSRDKMGLRLPPYCFTEQGLAMLSSVLNSARAIAVNIKIIRIFTRMREILYSHKDLLLRLDQLESKVSKKDQEIQMVFKVLKQLLNPSFPPRKKIGFKHYD